MSFLMIDPRSRQRNRGLKGGARTNRRAISAECRNDEKVLRNRPFREFRQ
jgi:hypothetical protein